MRPLHCTILLPLVLGCASLSAQVWTLEGPSSRHSHSAVFDPTTTQMIVYGGQATTTGEALDDVWVGAPSTTQALSFGQLTPRGSLPQGRYGHVATYDSGSNRMTIFGGVEGTSATCGNDVWILDRANGKGGTPNWLAMSPSGTLPIPRVYAAGAYDPTSNSLIVFGGSNCSTGFFNDVWIMSSANGETGTPVWTKLSTFGTPPSARQSGSAVYDSVNNILTVYGGDAGGSPFGDAWVLSNANGSGGTAVWTKLTPTGQSPQARTGQTGVYDSASNRMIISGGAVGSVTLTDSWILTSANGIGTPSWIKVASSGTAPSLAYHSAVYSQSGNFMYTFAGSSSADKLQTNSHAFALLGANGLAQVQSRWVLSGPSVRYGQSMYYDASSNSAFVFGGQHSKNNLNFNDYWRAANVLNSSNLKWTLLATKGAAPSARYGHTGLYDSSTNTMMVFGGSTGTCQNDYHVLQHANGQGGPPSWVTVTPTGITPPARALQASVYDAATNALIIFGGINCKTTFFNDVWILHNANDNTRPSWSQLTTAGTPPSVRESSTAIYDASTNSLIVYGGDRGQLPTGDLWILSHANGTGGTATWSQVVPSNNGPVARSGHTANYDATNNRMIVYGGFDGTNVLSDVWILSGANGKGGAASWSGSVAGQSRRFHSSQYDPASNQLITFGGSSEANPLVPSDDLYTLTDANGIQ